MSLEPSRVLRLRTDHFNLFCHVTLSEAETLQLQLVELIEQMQREAAAARPDLAPRPTDGPASDRPDEPTLDLHAGPGSFFPINFGLRD